jgi:uroporphyrin-III C-methyltransferase
MSRPVAGKVWLVGAGPGDPELLTLKAVRAIAQAEVLLVDDLVDRRVLEHAPARARIVEVGKRGGCPSTPQAFIERLLVHEARAGRRVVRLKGGDPMVFGRAGEEIDALRAAGIDFEVVPGVTAGLAAAAGLGAPLTDRRAAQGVAFVTGHTQPGGREPDWAALARSGLTLVVYMGMRRAAAIAQALCDGGAPADTPVAVVVRASLEGARERIVTLGEVAAAGRRPPAARSGGAGGGDGTDAVDGGKAGDRADAAPAAPGLLLIGDVLRARAALLDAGAAVRQAPAAAGIIAACDAA